MSARVKVEAPAKIPAGMKIPAEINSRLRVLAHDLSNSVETLLQASYLLAQMKLDTDTRRWAEVIEKASRDCARINREIREILRASA